MIRVNLLPVREEARQRALKEQMLLMVIVWVGIGLALSTWYGTEATQATRVRKEYDAVKSQTAGLEKEAGALKALEEEESRLKEKTAIIEVVDQLHAEPAKVLHALAQNIPNRVWITKMGFYPIISPLTLREPVVQGGESIEMQMLVHLQDPDFAIGIEGYAMSPKDLTDFAQSLTSTNAFDHMEFGEVTEVIYAAADIPVQKFNLFARFAINRSDEEDDKKDKKEEKGG
ncbi:MAG: hypothetical protein VX405_07005 [Myxococcota bacterium]|nr:hypothetical protein [Myxococcales bacterium]MEC7751231.1 hypothetical protein [Myxococcota bacterium]HBU47535.1 hypothetical protein [Myxococcales bacterium]|tara:strand:+ start:492 stop:1181 length:690 start_codon:yes stop_codon:yes gene_type:complete